MNTIFFSLSNVAVLIKQELYSNLLIYKILKSLIQVNNSNTLL